MKCRSSKSNCWRAIWGFFY